MLAESSLIAVGTFGLSTSSTQVVVGHAAASPSSGGTLVSRNDQRIDLLSAADISMVGSLTADHLLDCYEDVARMVLNSPAATSASQTYLLSCRALQVQPDAAARLCCEATDVLANRRVSLVEENELRRVEEVERQAERALGADYWQSHKRSIEEALRLEDNRRKQTDDDEREAAMQEDYLYQNDKVVEQLRLQLNRAARTPSPGASQTNGINAQEEQHLNHLNAEAIRIQKRINELRKNGIPCPCCDVCDSHDLEPKRDSSANDTHDDREEYGSVTSLSRRDYFLLAIAEDDTRCYIEEEEVKDRSLHILQPFYKSMELMAGVLTTSGGTLGWSTTMTQEVASLTSKGLLPQLHPTQQRTTANSKNNTTPAPINKKGSLTSSSSGRYGSFPFPCYMSGIYNQIALLVTLPSCTSLKFLDVSNSRITSQMAVTLTQVLLRRGCMVKLNVLILDGNPIGSVAVEGLYSALQSHRSLHRISLLSGPQGIPSTTRKIEQLCTTREAIARKVDIITRSRDQCESVLEVGGRDEVRAEEVWGRRGLERMFASLLEGNVYALEGDGTMKLSAVSLAALEEINNNRNRVSSASNNNNSSSRFAPPSPPHQSRPSESRGSTRTVVSSDAASSSQGGSSSSSKRTDKSSKSKKDKDKSKKDKDKSTKSKSKSSKSKK